jgi:hypothetical protein
VECVLTFSSSLEVEFCGYSIPHPSEAKMNVRIQTYGELSLVFPPEPHFIPAPPSIETSTYSL